MDQQGLFFFWVVIVAKRRPGRKARKDGDEMPSQGCKQRRGFIVAGFFVVALRVVLIQ